MGTLSVDKLVKTSTGAAEFTLPATDGTAGQSMITDGSGQLSLGNPTLPADSVTASQIAANAVGNSEMADDAVGVAELSATGTASATTFLRGDNAWTGVANTPSFQVYLSADQAFSASAFTKIEFNTTDIDTATGWDGSTNYRYTVGASDAGKYLIFLNARIKTSAVSLLKDAQFRIKKNGGYTLGTSIWSFNSNPIREAQPGVVAILDLAAADYVEGFVYVEIASGTVAVEGESGHGASYFGGFKLI